MRIAYIGLRGVPAAYSGIERAVEEIGSRLVERGHEVTVYCMGKPESQMASYKGMRLEHVPCVRSKNLEMITYGVAATLKSMTRAFDVTHFHALGPATFSLLPRLAGRRSVVTVHGLDWKREKWGRLARLYLRCGEWLSSRIPDRTIVVSRTLQNYYAAVHHCSADYIPNGIPVIPDDPDVQSRRLRAPGYVLFVGRLTPEKQVHTLIEAFRKVKTESKLVIVGGAGALTGYENRLRALAQDDNRIELRGPMYGEELSGLFLGALLYVLPSAIEGLPIALIEAMAYASPVLVSDIPENLEVIQHGGAQCGHTFSTGSSEDLADKLQEILSRPELLVQQGMEGRAMVRAKYDWDAISTETEELYRQVCSRQTSPKTAAEPAA